MLQMMGDAGRDMVNARGCGGDERHDFNVNDTATLEPVGCVMKRQPATNDNKVAKDGGEALSKRSAKAKQEREKGFKPSQYKTRMCRRCAAPPRALAVCQAAEMLVERTRTCRRIVQPKPCRRIVLLPSVESCPVLLVEHGASRNRATRLRCSDLISRYSCAVAGGTR